MPLEDMLQCSRYLHDALVITRRESTDLRNESLTTVETPNIAGYQAPPKAYEFHAINARHRDYILRHSPIAQTHIWVQSEIYIKIIPRGTL